MALDHRGLAHYLPSPCANTPIPLSRDLSLSRLYPPVPSITGVLEGSDPATVAQSTSERVLLRVLRALPRGAWRAAMRAMHGGSACSHWVTVRTGISLAFPRRSDGAKRNCFCTVQYVCGMEGARRWVWMCSLTEDYGVLRLEDVPLLACRRRLGSLRFR